MKFLDLIKETEEEYPGVNKFLSYLYQAPAEDLYVKVSRRSSVRILTVHKAKGLEFPVVIIPFLRVEINPETGGRKSSSYLECSEPPYAGILRITRNHRYYSGFLNQVYSRAFKKACVDELNNLYVALTRARFELYAFIPKKSGPSVNKAGYFIDGEILERGVRKHSSSYYRKGKEEQNLLSISPPLYKDWILSLYDEIRDAVPLNKREEKYAGTVAHFFLSCLGNMKDRDYNLIMNVAREKTGNKYPYFEKLRSLEETVSRLVGRECLRGFFYVSDGDVYCEQEVIDMNGNSKRIDRLIVKKDDVWVIDYKNSPDLPEEHMEQVREYLDIVKGIYPGRKARGFIIYLTGDPLISVE